MNRQYQYKVSLKNYSQLLRNLQNMSEDYFFLPYPVDLIASFSRDFSLGLVSLALLYSEQNESVCVEIVVFNATNHLKKWILFN